MRRAAAVAALVWLSQGCVPKGRYLELEASYDQAVADRDRAASEGEACAAARRYADDLARDPAARLEAAVARMRGIGVGEVVATEPRATLGLLAAPLFAQDTADLSPEGEVALAKVAAALVGASGARILVVARTGAPPANTKEFPTAWHLGADRAIAVVRALTERGVPADRLVAASSATEGGVEAVAADRIDLVWLPDGP